MNQYVQLADTACDLRNIHAMADNIIVLSRDNEFGEMTVALNREAVMYTAHTHVVLAETILFLRRPTALMRRPKLELCILLSFKGWSAEDGPISPWFAGAGTTVVMRVSLWDRCELDIGAGTQSYKLYFTALDESAGSQRGFCPSTVSRCCKWMHTHLLPEKRKFAAWMYALNVRGKDGGITASEHLQFVPDERAVADIEYRLRMHAF